MMRAHHEGFIVRMSNGATDACQRLRLVDGNDFNMSFVDVANFQRHYSDRYSVSVSSPVRPAKVHLSMFPRLMGADIQGNLILYPLVARDDMIAFVSCIERGLGLFITEQVLVFTPYSTKDNQSLTDHQIKQVLKENHVPRVDELKQISQDCTQKEVHAAAPLSLDLYNLISNFQNPFGGVSGVALTYGSPNQRPSEVAGEIMEIFRQHGISPAQFYASTGSTIIQNQNQAVVPQSDVPFNAFHKMTGLSNQQSLYPIRHQMVQRFSNNQQVADSGFNLNQYMMNSKYQPQKYASKYSIGSQQLTPSLSADLAFISQKTPFSNTKTRSPVNAGSDATLFSQLFPMSKTPTSSQGNDNQAIRLFV